MIRVRSHNVRIMKPRRLRRNAAIAGLLDTGRLRDVEPPHAEHPRVAEPSSVIDG
jgi:hypothetical protein